ncbi:MAG: metal-sulfur cluster assembly factor [Solirubrobacterales bacterium]
MSALTAELIYEALEQVIDPELGLDFVELGLIYDVSVEPIDEGHGNEVYVTYSLTSPGCPIGPQIADQIKEFTIELDGVEKVFPKLVFSPPWTPEMMSEDAKFALGY